MIVANNSVNAFFYGIRTDDHVSNFTFEQNQISGSKILALLFSSLPTKGQLSGSWLWSLRSIAKNGIDKITVEVTGTVIGDAVALGFSQALPAGLLFIGNVTSANTVTVSIYNVSEESITLESGTFYAEVFKH